MFKRIMSVMLAVVMLMSVAVVAVSAAEESDKLYIRLNGDAYYEVKQGETYTYVYSLACDKKICSLDCTTYFDVEGLKFVPEVDEDGDYTGAEFPNISAVYNLGLEGKVLYNYSSPSGVKFPVNDTATEKNVVFQGKFEVTAESGIYDIYTDLKVLGDNSNNKIIFDSEKVDEAAVVYEVNEIAGLLPVETPVEPTPTEPTPTEPAPTEPTPTEPAPTEPAPTDAPDPTEPATVEPTDAPTEDESAPAPATKDQSSSNDQKTNTNTNAVKTGSTTAAIALITVLVMAAGVVMFSSKKKFD